MIFGSSGDGAVKLGDLNVDRFEDPLHAFHKVQTKGFIPRGREVAPFALQNGSDWFPNRGRVDRNWLSQLHMWRWIDPALGTWEAGDPISAEGALAWIEDRLRDWWEGLQSASPWARRFIWSQMRAGLRAQRLAFLLSAVPLSDPKQSDLFTKLWRSHASYLLTDECQVIHNHAIDAAHGLVALGRAAPNESKAQVAREAGEQLVERIMTDHFTDNMVCREDSISYHVFTVGRIRSILNSGWYPSALSEKLEPAIHRTSLLRLPDGRIPSIGDSNYSEPRESARDGISDTDDELAGLTATLVPNGQDVTDSRIRKPKKEDTDPIFASDWNLRHGGTPQLSAFDGYVNGRIRQFNTEHFFFLMGACNSGIHKHADDLSIIWGSRSEDYLIDPGKFSYDNEPMRNYLRSGASHNTITVGGESVRQHYRDPVSPMWIDMRISEQAGATVVGSVKREDGSVSWTRSFEFKDDYLLVSDNVACDEVEEVQIHWQFAPSFSQYSLLSQSSFECTSPTNTMRVTLNTSEYGEWHLRRGIDDPDPFGWASQGYRKRLPALNATWATESRSLSVKTMFTIQVL